MQSGHTGVFQRRYKADVDPKKHGLPLTELFGPSVPQMLTTVMEKDGDIIGDGMRERFETRFEHEIQRFLEGMKP